MGVLQAIFPCMPAQRKPSFRERDFAVVDEKLALYTDEEPSRISIAEATESIIDTLRTTEKPGADLKSSIDSIVHQAGGWSERIATGVLNALVKVLQDVGSKMGPALKEAYERACSVANGVEGFVRDHPVFVTVLALGVLVALTPFVLEMLGFAELGIVRGSWAALWQARYAGFVPKGSLFSFLQRMGMVWGKGVLQSRTGEQKFRTMGVVDAWTKERDGASFSFDLVGMRELEWRDGFDDDGGDDDSEDEWRTSFNSC